MHPIDGCSFLGNGSSGVASRNRAFSIFINPAKIADLNQADIEIYYRNYFGLKDLNQISLANHFRIGNVPFGLGITRYGNKLYNETEIRAGSAIRLSNDIFFGISINAYHLKIENYGNAVSWGFDLAGIYKLTNFLSTGFVLSNLMRQAYSQSLLNLGEARCIPSLLPGFGSCICVAIDVTTWLARSTFDHRPSTM